MHRSPDATRVVIKARFVGFHRWTEAPDVVSFLRGRHRHEFHVEVHLGVTHEDRDLEFFTVKNYLLDTPLRWLNRGKTHTGLNTLDWSCEMMAEYIGRTLQERYGSRYTAVEVSEDGENGGLVVWDH